MRQFYRSFLGLVLGALVMHAPLWADDQAAERAELKARIEQLRGEAKELSAQGNETASTERLRKVRELSAKLRSLSETPIGADKRQREKEVARMAERLECMRIAAEHLKKAEMHELAVQVQRRADELEQKVHVEKERLAAVSDVLFRAREDRSVGEGDVGGRAGEAAKAMEIAKAGELSAWKQDVMLEMRDQVHALRELREAQEVLRNELKEMARRLDRQEIETNLKRPGR